MSNVEPTKAASAPAKDERVKDLSRFRKALIRPELGAICGTIAVFVFFLILAGGTSMFALDGVVNWSTVSAQFIVLAVGVCLLMIAGEFDLSLGSMVGFSGMVFALLVMKAGIPVWVAILLTFALCAALGAINGWMVIRTGLPSFIVTLAFLFILRGAHHLERHHVQSSACCVRSRRRRSRRSLCLAFRGEGFHRGVPMAR